MTKNHGPQIKDDKRYEKIREQGASKEKAARIANTSRKTSGRRGRKSPKYEDMTKEQLNDRAKKIGISGYSKMNKGELIKNIRKH